MDKDISKILDELKPGETFAESESFIDDGLLDSFDIVTLVSILEEKYGIEIDGLDIVADNFQNIDAIVNLVNKSKRV